MLKNEDIICISSIDWDFIWQGHQEIMTRLARQGNRVLFIENTGVRVPNFRDIGRIRKRLVNWKMISCKIWRTAPSLTWKNTISAAFGPDLETLYFAWDRL